MIDIEPIVFEAVRNAVSPVKCFPNYQDRSKVFPLVTVEEYDNSVYEKTQDSGNSENHARLLYEVNVYSNLASGKKAQAKEIIKKVDEVMAKMGFVDRIAVPLPTFPIQPYIALRLGIKQ